MIDQQNSPVSRKLRSRALVGTAIALALGAGFIAEGVILPQGTAYADPVRVEGAAPASFADIVDKVRPAVVSVRVKSLRSDASASSDDDGMPGFDFPPGSPMEKFFKQFRQGPRGVQPKAQPSLALGSGFFISDDGYVVTNNHVIDKEQSVTVITDDGTEYTAKVVGKDDKTDLALLKVDAKDVKFTYVKLADKESRVGDWVVAVGNPFGLGGTVTAGIVSARGREIGAGPYDDFIQIDAPVNRGNSGGPTFNTNGEVIGVNTAIFSPSGGSVGIAFDIPASTVKQVIGDLREHGAVVRGWLGVQIQPISKEIADSIKLDGTKGALIAEPQKNGPAIAAGLKAGDAITAVDGNPVKDPRDLAAKIAAYAPGTTVKVTYWRDGASHDIEVKLGKLPSDEQLASNQDDDSGAAQPSALDDFGLALGPSDDQKGGVVVTEVDPNGQAAERGLQPGDVILSVGDAPVKAPSDIEKKVAAAKADGSKAVLLRVQSGDQTRFVALSFAHT